MKRLLLPLLAAITLPTAASAESVWLLIRSYIGDSQLTINSINSDL